MFLKIISNLLLPNKTKCPFRIEPSTIKGIYWKSSFRLSIPINTCLINDNMYVKFFAKLLAFIAVTINKN